MPTPKERAQYWASYRPNVSGGVRATPDQPGLLTQILGKDKITSPSMDAQGRYVPATGTSGFLSGYSQRKAAEMNLIARMQEMAQMSGKELQGADIAADKESQATAHKQAMEMKKLEDIIANASKDRELGRAVATRLGTTMERLVQHFPANDTRIASELALQNNALDPNLNPDIQPSYNQGANMAAIGTKGSDLYGGKNAVPPGGIAAMPSFMTRAGTLSGATVGPSTPYPFVESEIPMEGGSSIKKMGIATMPGETREGKFSPAVSPTIRAAAMSLDPNASASSEITPVPANNQPPSGNFLDLINGSQGFGTNGVTTMPGQGQYSLPEIMRLLKMLPL